MKSYVIGADGGGTKTDMILIDYSGHVLARAKGGSTNIQVVGGEKVKTEIISTASELIRQAGINALEVDKMFLGLAGAGRKSCQDEILALFLNTEWQGRVAVESDALAALAGAFGNKAGIILIAGTGSICFGMDENGNVFRSGGWGYLLGDEGSGYSIGNQAIIAALKDFDGRGPGTELRQAVEMKYHLESVDQIIPLIYQNKIDRSAVADLASQVFDLAEKKDHAAAGIILKTGEELGRLIAAVARKMKSENSPLRVALIGGVFSRRDMLLDSMRGILQPDFPDAEIGDPVFPPCAGAAVLALKEAGIHIDERILGALEASLDFTEAA